MTRLSVRHILAVTAALGVVSATQQPFTAPTTKLRQPDSLLSAPFLSFVDEIRQNGSIPGISIGVVRLGEDKEPFVQLAASGRKTEEGNGHDLTGDVRCPFILLLHVSEAVHLERRHYLAWRRAQKRSLRRQLGCSWKTMPRARTRLPSLLGSSISIGRPR